MRKKKRVRVRGESREAGEARKEQSQKMNGWDGLNGMDEWKNATEPCVQRRHAMKIAYDVQKPSSLPAPRAYSRPIMRCSR
jgi:hypothetical protein